VVALLIRDLVYPVTVNFQFCERKVISYISLEHSNVMVRGNVQKKKQYI